MRHKNKLLTLTWREKKKELKTAACAQYKLQLVGERGGAGFYTLRQHLYKPDSIKLLQVCSHFHCTLAICISAVEKQPGAKKQKNKGAFVLFIFFTQTFEVSSYIC